MMLGGGLMMGIGWLMMLTIIGIPALLIVALAGGTAGYLQRRNETVVGNQQPVTSMPSISAQHDQSAAASTQFCSHCGAGLQPDWTHCPQCGAPIS